MVLRAEEVAMAGGSAVVSREEALKNEQTKKLEQRIENLVLITTF
jgi:hypothetical protein